MKDIEELICRFSEGALSPEDRRQLYAYLAEHPEKQDEIRAVLSGANSSLADFEDIDLPLDETPSIVRSAATFVSPEQVVHGKQRYNGQWEKGSYKDNVDRMLSDIMHLK